MIIEHAVVPKRSAPRCKTHSRIESRRPNGCLLRARLTRETGSWLIRDGDPAGHRAVRPVEGLSA